MPNRLYYGDNLDVLRNEIATESVDLVYLDPPFNSQATFNVLFRSPSGEQAERNRMPFASDASLTASERLGTVRGSF